MSDVAIEGEDRKFAHAYAEYEGVTAKELAETVARYGKALDSISRCPTSDQWREIDGPAEYRDIKADRDQIIHRARAALGANSGEMTLDEPISEEQVEAAARVLYSEISRTNEVCRRIARAALEAAALASPAPAAAEIEQLRRDLSLAVEALEPLHEALTMAALRLEEWPADDDQCTSSNTLATASFAEADRARETLAQIGRGK